MALSSRSRRPTRMFAGTPVMILLLTVLICLLRGTAGQTDDTFSQPQVRPLTVTEFLGVLDSEVEQEYEVYIASFNLTEEETLQRAEELWGLAYQHELRRAHRVQVEENKTFPFIIGNDQPNTSGFQRRRALEAQLPDGIILHTVYNGPDAYYSLGSIFYSDAVLLQGDNIVLHPLVMAMKMKPGTIEFIEESMDELDMRRRMKGMGRSLRVLQGENGDEEVDDEEIDDEEMTPEYPSADILLCPGILHFLDVPSDGIVLDLTASMNTLLRMSGNETNLTALEDALYFTNLTNTSSGLPLTDRIDKWAEIFELALRTDLCDDAFNRLTWLLVLGPQEDDFTHLLVEFNNTGAETIDSKCALALVAAFAVLPEVCSLEIRPGVETDNDYAQWLVQSGRENVRQYFEVGLDGRGQIVAVSDTGVDTDNCYFWDANQPVLQAGSGTANYNSRKIVSYTAVQPGVSAFQRDYMYGHGTHVAGTIAGRRAQDGVTESTGMVDGVARGAKLAVYDFGDNNGKLHLPSSDFTILQTGRQGAQQAHLHSASWGSKGVNSYTNQARNFDQFMYENDDFLICVAAGNEGDEGFNTVSSPSTAKNVLTVGASHSYGKDLPSGLRPGYVADFSSRGPTSDGRTKPDLVAPGKFILSAGALPDRQGECDPGSRPSPGYTRDGVASKAGTSMATPVTSGAAAIVRQYFEEGWYPSGVPPGTDRNVTREPFSPSGALVKAVLMNGAQFLLGYDGGNVSPYDNIQNFGVVSLIDSLYIPEKTNIQPIIWDRQTVVDGATVFYRGIEIDKSNGCESTILSVTLTWVERGSTPGCTKCVQNDLDLSVTRENSTTIYYPNGKTGPDSVNNVERVQVSNVADGERYDISVRASNLDRENQQFALVATGCFGGERNEIQGETVYEEDEEDDNRRKIFIIVFSVLGGLVVICILCILFSCARKSGA